MGLGLERVETELYLHKKVYLSSKLRINITQLIQSTFSPFLSLSLSLEV